MEAAAEAKDLADLQRDLDQDNHQHQFFSSITNPTQPPPTLLQQPLPAAPVSTFPVERQIVFPTTPVRKPLSVSTKVGIAVAVVLVVGALVGFLIYWLVLRHPGSSSGGSGTDKFGTISITEISSNIQSSTFAPGAKLQLTYTPSVSGFAGRSVWKLSTDGGQTFAVPISDPSYGNSVQWTIPATVFTQAAVFRVSDHDNPADFVQTSNSLTIEPTFTLTKGPGLTHTDDIVYTGIPVTCAINTDTGLTGLSTTGFSVQLSKDPQFINGITTATLGSVTIDPTNSTVTVSWTIDTTMTDVLYRINTTTLVAAGYPFELSATSPVTIEVHGGASCDGVDNSGDTEFILCSMVMTEASSGGSGNFAPSSAVNLQVAYRNTYPGSATFAYTANGTTTAWAPVTLTNSTSTILTFAATLPNLVTTGTETFVVTMTSGSATLNSPPYKLQASAVINNLAAGSTVSVNPTCQPLNRNTTVLTLTPPDFTATWQVGYKLTNGVLRLFDVISTTYKGGNVTLVWCLDWTDFQTDKSLGMVPGQLVFSGQNGGQVQVQPFVVVNFNVVNFTPIFVPLLTNTGIPLINQVPASSSDFTLGFANQAADAMALVHVGNSNYYNIVSLSNFAFGAVVEAQNISNNAPDSPIPVNYVQAVALNQASQYLVTESPNSTPAKTLVNFTPVANPTQMLYVGPYYNLAQLTALYALNAGTSASSTSDFYWPGQMLPF